MKDNLGLCLIILGLFPILILEKLTKYNQLSNGIMFGVCPLLSIGIASGLGFLLGGWLYSLIGIVILFIVNLLVYWKGFA